MTVMAARPSGTSTIGWSIATQGKVWPTLADKLNLRIKDCWQRGDTGGNFGIWNTVRGDSGQHSYRSHRDNPVAEAESKIRAGVVHSRLRAGS